MYEILHYLTADGRDEYKEGLRQVRDPIPKVQLVKQGSRTEQGNFGDHKFCREGVWELRVSVGVGYRVYYAQSGSLVILLLCGGDKRTQDADIERAVKYWQDWQRRPDDEK